MTMHLRNEFEKLKKRLLALSALAEESVQQSIQSVLDRNESLATRVINLDSEIDTREVDLEEECLKILALHQPVASDLRFLIAVLKINNDLERIGDLSVNIAERSIYLCTHMPVTLPANLARMAEITRTMLRQALDSLINLDNELAMNVLHLDEQVDDLNREMHRLAIQELRDQPDNIETLLHLLSVSRYLERIADHATNIAEDVYYLLNGEIIRHQTGSNSPQ